MARDASHFPTHNSAKLSQNAATKIRTFSSNTRKDVPQIVIVFGVAVFSPKIHKVTKVISKRPRDSGIPS